MLDAFHPFGPVLSTRIFTELTAGYVQFVSADGFHKALTAREVRLRGRKYPLKSYQQMAEKIGRFSRGNLVGMSGKWKGKVVRMLGVANGNEEGKFFCKVLVFWEILEIFERLRILKNPKKAYTIKL